MPTFWYSLGDTVIIGLGLYLGTGAAKITVIIGPGVGG